MPSLDVSFVIDDPAFNDDFTITRRTDTIDAKGRTVPVETLITDLSGVVTQESPADLMRSPEAQMMPHTIFVASRFIMRGPSTGFQPDVINWAGTSYTVTKVLNYSRFGDGFCEVIAVSMVATNSPPV